MAKRISRLGDKISKIATPVARMMHLDCIDRATGQLKIDSTCAKVRDDLNEGRYKDAFYDRFFRRARERKQNGRSN
jgi:hypothetical protein